MKYAIVTIEWCANHGINVPENARKSIDGTKIIFHYGYIEPVLNGEKINTYDFDSKELKDILNSDEWINNTII